MTVAASALVVVPVALMLALAARGPVPPLTGLLAVAVAVAGAAATWWLTGAEAPIRRRPPVAPPPEEPAMLLAEAVHELRNELFAISGYADLLVLPEPGVDQEVWRVECGTAIRETAAELAARIDDILDLAQCEAGRMRFDLEDMDVAVVLTEMADVVTALVRGSGLHAEVDVPEGLPPVRADRRRLAQVVLNLVTNAVKYTPAGGTVSLRVRAGGRQVEIEVEDTGVGIAPEIGERVFEPFYRVRHGAAAHSSGLGLAVARRLVEGQGGGIRYRSRPGEGTTFTVSLPAAR